MPRVRITQDTLWYDHSYRKGEEVQVEGREYLDLLLAGRVAAADNAAGALPPVLGPDEIEGRHAGQTVFVLGNGPSLKLAAPRRQELAACVTVGVNRSFRLIESNYLLFLDHRIWASLSEEILACGALVFCPRRLHLPYFTQFGRYHAKNKQDVLSQRWRDGLYWSRSSVAAAVNLAYLFGAAQIALLGVDLQDNSHFYSGYGYKQEFPHKARIIEDLWWMSRRLRAHGVRLFNCSPESVLRGFDTITLKKLLARVVRKEDARAAGAPKGSHRPGRVAGGKTMEVVNGELLDRR